MSDQALCSFFVVVGLGLGVIEVLTLGSWLGI